MKPIRVALSGSGFKFPAHVGALLAIRDAGFTPVEYAGTSGGSIIATLAACGMSLDDMRSLTLSRDWSDMLSFSLFGWARMGYCTGSKLLDWLNENTRGKTFAQLGVDLTVMASDISTEAPYPFRKDTTPDVPVAIAARASASIPLVYTPVQYSAALLMDGGCVNNIPVDQLAIDSVPRIGIQLVSKCTPLAGGIHTLFDIVPRVIDMMLSANENTHVDLDMQIGAKFAFVETGYVSGLDRSMAPEMRQRLLSDGYAATQDALKGL